MTIDEIIKLRESEDNIEFKQAHGGNYSYNGGTKSEVKKRRRSIVGYVIALANENGGYLVFGIKESYPHEVVGTQQSVGELGSLESRIYRDVGIRVECEEIYDASGKRVLLIQVPARPKGKVYKFEDVPLMRVGEELKPMSDSRYLQILQEQEPDFSQKICPGLQMSDLDSMAIEVMKSAYAKKQNNVQFLTLSHDQIIGDLELARDGKLTWAALILLGKEGKIRELLPQAAVFLEYRQDPAVISFDNRFEFKGPFFI